MFEDTQIIRGRTWLNVQVYQYPNPVLRDLVNNLPPTCPRGSKDIIAVKVLFELECRIKNMKICYYSIAIKIIHKIGLSFAPLVPGNLERTKGYTLGSLSSALGILP